MARVFEIADGFIDTVAEHHPLSATHMGIGGFDHLMPNYAPESAEAFNSDVLAARKEMESAIPTNEAERMCRDTFIDHVSNEGAIIFSSHYEPNLKNLEILSLF